MERVLGVEVIEMLGLLRKYMVFRLCEYACVSLAYLFEPALYHRPYIRKPCSKLKLLWMKKHEKTKKNQTGIKQIEASQRE